MFLPEGHQQLDRHFHGLKSWAMYQHVVHRVSLATRQDMFEEFFGLRVEPCGAPHVQGPDGPLLPGSLRWLLAEILAGRLLHIDETEVALKTGQGLRLGVREP